jgi:alpha-galactosidase
MAGLDPSKNYRIRELNKIDLEPLPYEGKVFSGKFLMETGLEIPYSHKVEKILRNDWSSRVLYLVEE